MKNDSLIKSYDIIVTNLLASNNIDNVDKIEILLNLKHFLDPNKYKQNVKILQLEQENNKWRYKNESND